MAIVDPYVLKARIAPSLVLALPVWLATTVWLPGLSATSLFFGTASSFAFAFLLGQLGRDLGTKKQTSLFRSWGGAPATAFLRHRDPRLNALTRVRCHSKLAALTGFSMPSPADESDASQAAETVYEACIDFLRTRTRDEKRFPLVAAENASYGFRRNLWGMRWAGAGIAVLASVACLVRVGYGLIFEGAPPPAAVLSSLISISLSVLWFLRFTPSWVRIAAEAYARALLAACEELEATQPLTATTDAVKQQPT